MFRYYICHKKAPFIEARAIKSVLNKEKKYQLTSIKTYKKFYSKIQKIKINLTKIIQKLIAKKNIIHGYGASTKGNVLLQYFKITNNQISFIAERNPSKYNKYTPGTKIKIISEDKSRKMKPNYYLTLPWHFRKEILIREKNMIKKGTKFIFPMPSISIK